MSDSRAMGFCFNAIINAAIGHQRYMKSRAGYAGHKYSCKICREVEKWNQLIEKGQATK